MNPKAPILIIGGNGKTGRRIVQRLVALGHDVRVGSPNAQPRFVWEDPETWPAVLEGVERLYIAHPDVTQPNAAQQINAFSKLAVSKGARRIVLLSGRENPLLKTIEEAVIESGADWTMLRPSWFAQNFSEGFLLDAVLKSEIELPVGEGREAFIDVGDIADVAVAALLDDRHIGQIFELSGPRLLSFSDVAAELSAASGRDIRYVPISQEKFRATLREIGMPESLADGYAEIEQGRHAFVTDGVERALGRKATDFAEFARDAAARGAWK